jgi:serine/threonine-protein kinase Chk1
MLFVRPSYFLKLTSQSFSLTTPQSQTQGGTRYIPHLTRFWASLAPLELLAAVENELQVQGARVKRVANEPGGGLRCRISALDHRHMPVKGGVIIEPFSTVDGSVGSFCIMERDMVINYCY